MRSADQINAELGPKVYAGRLAGKIWDQLVYELGYCRARLHLALRAELDRRDETLEDLKKRL